MKKNEIAETNVEIEEKHVKRQWRIQRGILIPKVGVPTYYLADFSLKIEWKMKELDWRAFLAPPGSANEQYSFSDLYFCFCATQFDRLHLWNKGDFLGDLALRIVS